MRFPWLSTERRVHQKPLLQVPFLGRDALLEAFAGHLRAAQAGATQYVVLTGPPGSGKSALLQEFALLHCTAPPVLFVSLQGVEFQRLYAQGLTLQSGPYGAIFFSLIGCHAIHVLGGLIGWAAAFRHPERSRYARLYWYFVTAVWLILFGILYIL